MLYGYFYVMVRDDPHHASKCIESDVSSQSSVFAKTAATKCQNHNHFLWRWGKLPLTFCSFIVICCLFWFFCMITAAVSILLLLNIFLPIVEFLSPKVNKSSTVIGKRRRLIHCCWLSKLLKLLLMSWTTPGIFGWKKDRVEQNSAKNVPSLSLCQSILRQDWKMGISLGLERSVSAYLVRYSSSALQNWIPWHLSTSATECPVRRVPWRRNDVCSWAASWSSTH